MAALTAFSDGGTGEVNATNLNAIVTRINAGSWQDTDADTKIQVEESADEDKIRFDTGGVERAVLDATALDLSVGLVVDGDVTLGDASTDTITCAGRLILRQVTDAGPMTATAGTKAELVYNLSNDKVYVCTVTGNPATWVALN